MIFRNRIKGLLGKFQSFNPRVQAAIDAGLTVFAFHDVTNRPSTFAQRYGLYVTTATFERQVQWIGRNFNLISPGEILNDKKLPERSAIISFDDGYRGTFENGLRILEKLKMPSIIFLNMAPILQGDPLLSAAACFMGNENSNFSKFCKYAGISRPFHLSLSPDIWREYQQRYGPVDRKAISEFQGEFANWDSVKSWDSGPLVQFGNHLFEHWNAKALTADEFEQQYSENKSLIEQLASYVNLFAFTNGQPNTCFTSRELGLLNKMGAGRAFSTWGGVNQSRESFLLGRVALCENDKSDARLWFRIFWAIQQEKKSPRLLP